jgi:hypothetical protein
MFGWMNSQPSSTTTTWCIATTCRSIGTSVRRHANTSNQCWNLVSSIVFILNVACWIHYTLISPCNISKINFWTDASKLSNLCTNSFWLFGLSNGCKQDNTSHTSLLFWGNIVTFDFWNYNTIFIIETFLKCGLQKCEKEVPNFIYFNFVDFFSIGPF